MERALILNNVYFWSFIDFFRSINSSSIVVLVLYKNIFLDKKHSRHLPTNPYCHLRNVIILFLFFFYFFLHYLPHLLFMYFFWLIMWQLVEKFLISSWFVDDVFSTPFLANDQEMRFFWHFYILLLQDDGCVSLDVKSFCFNWFLLWENFRLTTWNVRERLSLN
jgi:hypothetical protein